RPRAAGGPGAPPAPRREGRAPDRASPRARGPEPTPRQPARPVQSRQTGGIPPIRLDPIARPLRDQRRRHHNAVVPVRRQMTLDAIAARARLVAEPKPDALAAELAHQAIQGPRRVGDPTIFPDLAADAALGDRHDDPLLVNIKPDIRDTTRLLCIRLGTGQSGATLVSTYCKTGRPVLRRSGDAV